MNPWLALAAVALWAASGWYAFGLGRDHEIATQAREDRATQHAAQVAADTSARAIAQIQVRHETIVQQAETIIRERPVYRDCVHPAGMLDTINAARTGRPLSAGDGKLPVVVDPH